YAQDTDSVLFTKDFFDNDIALDLTLRFDIKKFINEKMDEEYLPATLSYFSEDSIEISKEVRIKTRGVSRKIICYFPPFFINVKGSNFSDDVFPGINKVKIVPLCKNSK
ncbi:MAG: hypothetical protein PF485_02555, partial [Bacteroidales bacterium]|nr:hypothetical protein [Bacteroidales bacterium]